MRYITDFENRFGFGKINAPLVQKPKMVRGKRTCPPLAGGSGTYGRKAVRVQVPPAAPLVQGALSSPVAELRSLRGAAGDSGSPAFVAEGYFGGVGQSRVPT